MKTQMQQTKNHFIFTLLLLIYAASMIFNISEISIHHIEAVGFFYSDEFAFRLARFTYEHFGRNDFALRAPFLLIHLANVWLIYTISLNTLQRPTDAILTAVVYMLMPGFVISAVLIYKTSFVIFIVLCCVDFQMRHNREPYIAPLLSVFLDPGFSVLYLGMFFYALRNRHTKYVFFCLACLAVNLNLFGIDVSGKPSNHFFSTISDLAILFSPLFLIYYIYALISSVVKKNEFMSYISLCTIGFVLILSVRQSIDIQTLLPLSVVALPVAIRKLLSDIRLHLPQFRRMYVLRLVLVLGLMFAQSSVIYFNKFLYFFDVKSHFAHSYYYGQEIAQDLKNMGISAMRAQDRRLELQLRFYGISNETNKILKKAKDDEPADIEIVYLGRIVARFRIEEL